MDRWFRGNQVEANLTPRVLEFQKYDPDFAKCLVKIRFNDFFSEENPKKRMQPILNLFSGLNFFFFFFSFLFFSFYFEIFSLKL